MFITNVIALIIGVVAVAATAWVFWNEFSSKYYELMTAAGALWFLLLFYGPSIYYNGNNRSNNFCNPESMPDGIRTSKSNQKKSSWNNY